MLKLHIYSLRDNLEVLDVISKVHKIVQAPEFAFRLST